MKRQIIVTIEPDDDGARCGECRYCAGGAYYCPMSDYFLKGDGSRGFYKRGPECLAAEKLMADLREAAQEAAGLFTATRDGEYEIDSFTRQPLDVALAAIDAQVKS